MKRQRGGTILGFILGVVVGLGIALGVAIYVTKVPVPFMNKSQSRTAEQDAEETKKNKDWDPNAAMYGKSGAKPAAADGNNNGQGAPAPAAQTPAPAPAPTAAPVPAPAPAAAPVAKPEPKAQPAAAAPAPADSKKIDAKSADPLGDLAKAKAGASTADPFIYWVQVGAYRTVEDAESQRAKLSLGGIETKLSEREQSGRMVYRVRVGPFDSKDDADKSKEKLEKAGLESVLVRVQR